MPGRLKFLVVVVTAPDLKTARRLGQAALHARLAACVNIVPKIESHYWWKGRLEAGREVLLLFKTLRRQVGALEKLVVAEHPYDTPEFVVLPIVRGNRRYLSWLEKSAE